MRLPSNETLNSTLSDEEASAGENSTSLSGLFATLLNQTVDTITSADNISDSASESTTPFWDVTSDSSHSTSQLGREETSAAVVTEKDGTTMFLPVSNVSAETTATAAAAVTEGPDDVGGLLSIHIHFIIVGVLFGLVIIMLGLHNYIEIMTDGGKKSLPAFGVSTGEKAKPRATLRPVVSNKSKTKTTGKTGSSGKGKGKK